ncbi:hypothetical protein D9M71_655600 [compost metagenome]
MPWVKRLQRIIHRRLSFYSIYTDKYDKSRKSRLSNRFRERQERRDVRLVRTGLLDALSEALLPQFQGQGRAQMLAACRT